MSSYIFIIMQELLSLILKQKSEFGNIKFFKYKGLELSHFSFADDLLIAIKGNLKNCKNLNLVLSSYYSLTNQKINVQKSEIFFPKHCQENVRKEICKELGFKEGVFPMKYLRAYISPHRLDKNHQEALLHKAIDKIDGWASKCISQPGRAILISSVMNSLPIHSLTASWTNGCVIKKFQKLSRNYLWSSSKCKKGMHLISWKNVTTRKSCGGLGLKDIGIFKYSIHASRILPFLNKEKLLWSKYLFSKYKDYHPWKPRNNIKYSWSFKCLHEAIQCLKEGLR
ncbi:hypothetical protein Cni_G15862 [Canna indica]|uniref:Reverse transcriptase domain-containing protein n=1 Tax=Canna indica TaxID=4628 RepID=A0AAQ3QG75_9LILI|nr:hypothetical protein Cni_G15862 [Canna indica]